MILLQSTLFFLLPRIRLRREGQAEKGSAMTSMMDPYSSSSTTWRAPWFGAACAQVHHLYFDLRCDHFIILILILILASSRCYAVVVSGWLPTCDLSMFCILLSLDACIINRQPSLSTVNSSVGDWRLLSTQYSIHSADLILCAPLLVESIRRLGVVCPCPEWGVSMHRKTQWRHKVGTPQEEWISHFDYSIKWKMDDGRITK